MTPAENLRSRRNRDDLSYKTSGPVGTGGGLCAAKEILASEEASYKRLCENYKMRTSA